jgi:hypothetical protein
VAVHLLHIGKTGGTALKAALSSAGVTTTAFGELHVHGHSTTITDLHDGDLAICFLRDPITRFVSAFDSRRRMGRPRYLSRWSMREALAFARFRTAADLAEALAAGRRDAHFAMASISHLNRHYTHWLGPVEGHQLRQKRLIFVGRQESLTEDVLRLRTLLDIKEALRLPDDPVAAHRNPTTYHRPLSDRAIAALSDWYRDDLAILSELTDTATSDAN